MDEMGWDIVLVSSHLGARVGDGGENPSNHAWWQGKFYSRTGKDPRFPPLSVTGYGTGEGLCGWNCRHSFGPGDGEHNPYTQFDTEENRKEYELQQRQRALERMIRNTKRDVMGKKEALDNCSDPVLKSELERDYQRKAALLQKQNKTYNDFCEENDLKRLQDRLTVAKWDRQQAAAASGAARRYENKKSARAMLKAKLADGSLTKDLNPITQASHMYDTRKPGKSYFKQGFTLEQLRQVINERSGTGTIRISKSGQIRETIEYDRDIGIVVSSDNIEMGQTNRFTIHYSLKRTHVIPTQKIGKEKMR